MRLRRVPNSLQNKVIKWFDYLWLTQKSSDEERAVSCLPGNQYLAPGAKFFTPGARYLTQGANSFTPRARYLTLGAKFLTPWNKCLLWERNFWLREPNFSLPERKYWTPNAYFQTSLRVKSPSTSIWTRSNGWRSSKTPKPDFFANWFSDSGRSSSLPETTSVEKVNKTI